MSYEEILMQLKNTRKTKGLSLKELAKEIGSSPSALSLMERGKKSIKLTDFLEICRVLAVDPTELLSEQQGIRAQSPLGVRWKRLTEKEKSFVLDIIAMILLRREE